MAETITGTNRGTGIDTDTSTIAVSIIMPCFNEENHIAAAIESLADEYVKNNGEILVVDGRSSDNTVEIAESYGKQKIPVRIIHNEKRLQCWGLNLGINEARGEFIVRVDAHSTYPTGYVKQLVGLLKETGAANVGGIMLPRGNSPVQRAVATAMRHPVGVGNAKFHLGNYKGYVDTVYLGAFRKTVFDSIGLYDTNCRTNEDAELNIRILKDGQKIFLDSSIAVEYLPRNSFRKLALQYFRYGIGRAYTTAKHKQITSLRQLAAPVLVIGLAVSAALSAFHLLFLLPWALYATAIILTALCSPMKEKTPLHVRLLTAVAFFIMHITWGSGFIVSSIKNLRLMLTRHHHSTAGGRQIS